MTDQHSAAIAIERSTHVPIGRHVERSSRPSSTSNTAAAAGVSNTVAGDSVERERPKAKDKVIYVTARREERVGWVRRVREGHPPLLKIAVHRPRNGHQYVDYVPYVPRHQRRPYTWHFEGETKEAPKSWE